jgi:hypothetical protein
MNDKPQIDPRYDPAFQRGYSGAVRTGEHAHGVTRGSQQPVRETLRPEIPADAPPTGGYTSVVPPAYVTHPDPEAELLPLDEEEVDDDATPPRRLTRNPFLFALALLGTALIVAGSSWALAGRVTMTEADSIASERDYWFVQAALLGAPVMIAAGVLILAGVLFVFAHAWNNGRLGTKTPED